MVKQRVRTWVAKTQPPPKRELKKGTVKWANPKDFLSYLKAMPYAQNLRGFITLKRKNYTDANWMMMCRHTQFLSKTGSIHNFRIYHDRIRIKLRPHNNRGY